MAAGRWPFLFAAGSLLLMAIDYPIIQTMNVEELREYALSLEKVTESLPFGNDTLVFKVGEKVFLLISLSADRLQFNVKCQPEDAVELREKYVSILPGYHMNKKHWNTIVVDGSLTSAQIKGFISDSYRLVKPKK